MASYELELERHSVLNYHMGFAYAHRHRFEHRFELGRTAIETHSMLSTTTSRPSDNPVEIPSDNMLSLLRVRHTFYMKDRTRYAIMRSAATR